MSENQKVLSDAEMKAERQLQREICKSRGHAPSNVQLTTNPPWMICRFCGMRYRHEFKLVEFDPDAED